jgi:SAM-dependent methyltransferase
VRLVGPGQCDLAELAHECRGSLQSILGPADGPCAEFERVCCLGPRTDPPNAVENERARAEEFVAKILPSGRVLKVLAAEAGHGQFRIEGQSYIVCVDVLQAEANQRRESQEQRVVDIDRLELEPDEYDVIVCVDVLEHARRPLALFPVVRNALKDGGLFVILVPNVLSFKGVVTRLAPRWFRAWLYARLGTKLREDRPVQSVHSFSLRPSSLLKQAESPEWELEYFRLYEGPMQRSMRRRIGLVGRRWRATALFTRVVTLGLVSADETGIIMVLSKIL